jgi:hypothetical protein
MCKAVDSMPSTAKMNACINKCKMELLFLLKNHQARLAKEELRSGCPDLNVDLGVVKKFLIVSLTKTSV